MNNLSDSGLNLRTIEVRQLSQIVSDLNYNFKQMLHLSGFKGQKGDDGDSTVGAVGQRGNMWVFADPNRFIPLYSSIGSSGQVSLPFINGQLTTSLTTLLLALNITELVQNDIIVLPSRDVIQFSSTTNQFIDTGIRFADGLSLTETEVINIVNNILGGLDNTDVFTSYNGVVKNYADNASGLNVERNFNSILDLPVTSAGIGVNSDVFKFTSLKEAVVGKDTQNMLLTGSPVKYHELAQRTMTDKTVDFMAGVDDFGALAVMQNSYKNGILVGSVDDSDFSTWGRIFRTENKFRFLSDYHPVLDRVSRLDLGKSGSELYSLNSLKMVVKSGFVSIEDYETTNKWFYATVNNLGLGFKNLPSVTVTQKNYMKIFSKIGATTDILGLYNNEVKASIFQPKKDTIVNDDSFLITHNLVYDFKTSVDASLKKIKEDIIELQNQEVYKEQTLHVGNVNANNIHTFGLHVLKRSSTSTYTNFPNSFLQQGLVRDAILKVQRFDKDNEVWVEQTFVHVFPTSTANANTLPSLVTSKRRGVSTNGGNSYTWGQWSYLLDSDNFSFKGGEKMVTPTPTFSDGFSLVVNHEKHENTLITAQVGEQIITDDHRVLLGIELDEWGHPINAIPQNLDEWYYTKPEVDAIVSGHTPIDSIIMFPKSPSEIPDGWFLCNGENNTLNLNGRFPVMYDPSNTDYDTVGKLGGASAQTLTIDNLPKHSHSGTTANSGNHRHGYSLHRARSRGEDGDDGFFRVGRDVVNDGVTEFAGLHSHDFRTNITGGGESFDNRPLFITLCFIQFKGFDTPTILTQARNFTGTVGVPFSFFTTARGVVTSWRAEGLPLGLTIDSESGEITGIPTTPISTTVTIIATNEQGDSRPYLPTFTISESVGTTPIITSDTQLDLSGVANAPFRFQITASGNPTSYSVSGLPNYLMVDSSTGLISRVPANIFPTQNEVIPIVISATNSVGTGTQKATLVVSGVTTGSISLPSLARINRTVAQNENVFYTHLNFGGQSTDWFARGLPSGLRINSETGAVTGTFSGSLFTSFREFLVTVSATNDAGTTTIEYTLTVTR